MRPSDDLFMLINSLNRLERGYFSKYAGIHVKGEENNYKKLFDLLCGMSDYSEEKLRKRLQGDDMLGYLSTAKNQLYNNVLRTMRPYYKDYSIDARLSEQVGDIDLLQNKALIKQARKQTAKVKSLCQENERYSVLIQTIRKEMKLSFEEDFHPAELSEIQHKSRRDQLMALQKLNTLLELEFLYNKIRILSKAIGKARNENDRELIDGLTRHELLQNENHIHGIESKTYWNLIHAEKHMMLSEFRPAEKYLSKITGNLNEKRKEITQSHPFQ